METHGESPRIPIPGSERVAPGTPSSPIDPTEIMTVTIVVRARHASAAAAATLAATPIAQRTYLTRAEFAAKHGADPADMIAVERFALDAGLMVVEADVARRSVVVSGAAGTMATAFGADVALYGEGTDRWRARTGSLSLPAGVAHLVSGVFGLDGRPQARAHFRPAIRPAAAGSVSYTPPQVARAYGFPATVTGAGETIALIELGGGFVEADLATYFTGLGIATPSVTAVGVDGATNAPAGDPNSADGEVMLDIEVAGAIAPGAKIVVYFAPNTDQGFLDAVTTAIHDTTNAPTIVSISWGGPESTWTAQAQTNFDNAFADAATLGITVCIAAGDNGSSDGETDGLAHVDFPASSPHALACGGTNLKASGTTISSETVWNDGSSGGATGGGVSDTFALPTWQRGANVPPSVNPGAHVGRGVPDVSGDADPESGYQTRVDGSDIVVGGTSAVAPLWAALIALVNQSLKKPAGFINPQLYANLKAARDITSGNNGAYAARAGWDACTGVGSPNGATIVQTLTA